MSLSRHARPALEAVFSPVARAALRVGLTPNAVTVIGTACSCALAIVLLGTGRFVAGSLLVTACVLFDTVDGLMSRISGTSSVYGAFLDSSLDRFADAAVLGSLAFFYLTGAGTLGTVAGADLARTTGLLALVALVLAQVISYVRARAESVGLRCDVGFAERGERLILTLVAAFLVGLGLPHAVMTVLLAVLVAACAVTVAQRMREVRRQAERGASPGGGGR